MELIKSTSAALATKLAEVDNINAQIDRAQAAIDAGIPGGDKIAALRAQRQNEIGNAFMEDRQPDVATTDKAIAKLEKDATDTKETIAGARVALAMLTRQAAQAKAELKPLQEAQDEAINAYAAEKDDEAVQMLNVALEAVNVAFNYMAASQSISRKPRVPGQMLLWQHRLGQVRSFNVRIDGTAERAALVAELTAAGVSDAGDVQVPPRPLPVPSQATPDPVVTFTYAPPADEPPPPSPVPLAPLVETPAPVVQIIQAGSEDKQAPESPTISVQQ